MTIDKQALLVSKAKASVFTMRYISQFEASDIDSDDIDLRFEVDGTETGTTVSIVDECGHAAQIITALLDELETKEEQRANWFQMAQKLGEDLDAEEKRNAEQREYYEGVIADGSKRIAELEKGHQEAAKQINSWRRLAKQNIAERGKDISELEAARQRIAEQSAIVAAAEKLVRCKGRYHSELNYRALAKLFGVVTPDLPPLEHENVHYADAAEVEITALRQRIQELEAKLETADKLQDSAFRDGLKAGFSYGQTDDQSGFAQCMSAYSTRAGIGVKQQEDSVDSDVGRNQPGMVVAVHIGAGDFVKVKGQVFEVEETDFDDHDVTLWFVGGNTLKCAAGCQVEVVSAPVAAGIKVKES
ncbi:ead/Ea22-like family protein [Salmonella enterica subsp. enterica serovar Madelia]|nr:ead/Ea22-like family protein [Salmonella enterica subsp. enterica serovar Madelia]